MECLDYFLACLDDMLVGGKRHVGDVAARLRDGTACKRVKVFVSGAISSKSRLLLSEALVESAPILGSRVLL